MKALKNHPGMWLRDDAADAINALEDKYGVIRINSAGRTEAEQQGLIDRWDKGGKANRPPALFEPKRPARKSTHVQNGGEAVDVYNYTDDRTKLEEFGFEWYGDGDRVHYTFRGWKGSTNRGGYANGSAELRIFQEKLIRMGHDLGSSGADAIFGERTKAATLHEQRMAERNGYPGGNVADDGLPGPSTNGYLDWWLAGAHHGTPSKAVGDLTYADIQTALNRHGYRLRVDNVWGKNSSNALADFQRRNGLTVDRIVGPKTWAVLGR